MTDSKVASNSDKGLQVDCETHVEAPVTMNGREKCSETQIPNRGPPEAKTQAESTTPRYHERKLGVWTLYFPVSDDNSSRSAIPSLLNLASISRNARNVQRFLAETFFLGPYAFVLYLVVLSLSRAMPSVQLYSNSKIISLAEQTFSNPTERTLAIAKFKQAFITYVITMVVGWVTRKLHTYTRAILEQRVTIHFTKRILSVRSRLDLSSVEDPAVQSLMDRATQSSSNAWAVLDGLADIVAVSSQVIALFSTLRSLLGSREDAKLLGLTYLLPPLLSELHWLRGQFPFYAIITNTDCLRMSALVSLGCNSSYRKEVLGGGLESHIDSAYAESMSRLGDALKQDPEDQLSDRRLLDYSDIFDIFDPVPLFVYAWNNLRGHSDLSMSSLVMMQQAANSMHAVVWRVVYRGKNLSDVFKNLSGLYEALETKPRFVDGHVSYPDEEHSEQKGMGIEFRNVNFEYPSSGKPALANMSFTIAPGQLCVIVGENGCGKSTTIGLITRLYDCNSGEVLIDGRPVRDYKVSTVRAAANIMYQDYHHLPLTIRENILLGRPNSKNPTQEIEEAAKLGGAYDFVQKLPRKFETNLEPLSTGFPSWSGGGNSADKYKTIVETEKNTKLSGGEWQRLALSRTFMKNSEKTRLLCYDEPSASLDPKAEYEIFERLRKLRGEKTMIFVTHRFGYLTRHADLILYVKEGSVVEQGTHTSLLAQGGEYAKVYNIQSQAFSDSPGE